MESERCSARAIAALADEQYGVVARRQLLALGVGNCAIGRRVAAGLLIPLHRGVYAVGHRRLAALDAHDQHGATLVVSELEERFLDLVLSAGLARPLLNVTVAGVRVDALWPAERLIVELDGWAHHRERAAAAWDREKSNRLQLAGYDVLRFMHGDLVRRPRHVASAIRAAIGTGER